YVVTASGGMDLMNVSGDYPVPFGTSLENLGYTTSVTVRVPAAYVMRYNFSSFHVVQVGEPFVLRRLRTVEVGHSARDAVVVGNHLLVVGHGAVSTLDISDPLDPLLLSTTSFPEISDGGSIAVAGDVAFVADWGSSVVLLDIADPVAPQLLAEIPVPALRLEARDDLLFAACYTNGLFIVDVSNPLTPVVLATVPEFDAWAVAAGEHFLYTSGPCSRVGVIDITNPATPVVVGGSNQIGGGTGMRVHDGGLYLAAGGLAQMPLQTPPPGTAAPAGPATFGGLSLEAPRPNPSRDRSTFAFSLPAAGPVRLGIFDVAGRLVHEVARTNLPAGRHVMTWDGSGRRGVAGAGVYFVRLEAGGEVRTRKVARLVD
ncbi:T9SS type A sorting domain-containing protein, partial [bacterium]|nr:T9SS type A sorting domain-containing protein [bacterium]